MRLPRPTPDPVGPGQESAWDYPRPPVVVPDGRAVEVSDAQGLVASTDRAVRVLETSHPPAFYLPPESVIPGRLVLVPGSSHCEWKGTAEYVAGRIPGRVSIGVTVRSVAPTEEELLEARELALAVLDPDFY